VSPDGQWLVFASSRDRPLDQTSLWIAHTGMTMPPRRLTQAATPAVIDAHPTWTPDGRAIVFSSTRDGGDFDLWRLELRDGQPGALSELTHGAGHEVTPAVAPDGTIVYAEVTPDEATHQIETHLEARAPDGTIRRLTDGPADSSPALSPDGQRLVFSRPAIHNGKPDAELWMMTLAQAERAEPVVDLPLTDESGPVWSRDGRFVFATSVVRGSEGNVVFSSIIHVDVREAPRVARILEDRVGALVRLTPAMTAVALDVAALHDDPAYLPELARILVQLVERAQQEAAPEAKPK
jgi:Tol biopolymer transport system component